MQCSHEYILSSYQFTSYINMIEWNEQMVKNYSGTMHGIHFVSSWEKVRWITKSSKYNSSSNSRHRIKCMCGDVTVCLRLLWYGTVAVQRPDSVCYSKVVGGYFDCFCVCATIFKKYVRTSYVPRTTVWVCVCLCQKKTTFWCSSSLFLVLFISISMAYAYHWSDFNIGVCGVGVFLFHTKLNQVEMKRNFLLKMKWSKKRGRSCG